MARNRKQRRQQHGSAWHWKQTDCWYSTEPGTRKRVPLFDEQGERVRGTENKEAARLALARVNLVDELKRKLKLPHDRCMYTCRHTFAKRTLSGYYTGVPVTIEVLAGLMGNTPKVCWDHYTVWADQYNDPLWAAWGKKPASERQVNPSVLN